MVVVAATPEVPAAASVAVAEVSAAEAVAAAVASRKQH